MYEAQFSFLSLHKNSTQLFQNYVRNKTFLQEYQPFSTCSTTKRPLIPMSSPMRLLHLARRKPLPTNIAAKPQLLSVRTHMRQKRTKFRIDFRTVGTRIFWHLPVSGCVMFTQFIRVCGLNATLATYPRVGFPAFEGGFRDDTTVFVGVTVVAQGCFV